MAPSFVDCGVASLYCAEEVSETTWDEEESGGACLQVEAKSQPAVFLDFPVEDEEAISTLLLKEAQYMPEPDYSARYVVQELDAEARLECVRWIQKVDGAHLQWPPSCRPVLSNRPIFEVSDADISDDNLLADPLSESRYCAAMKSVVL